MRCIIRRSLHCYGCNLEVTGQHMYPIYFLYFTYFSLYINTGLYI